MCGCGPQDESSILSFRPEIKKMVKLLKANLKDFETIAEIYMEAFSQPPFNEPWTRKQVLDKVKIFSKYCEIWKITDDKKIIGFVIINPNQWYPGKFAFGEEMAIKKEYRGRGIGTKMMKEILEIYEKRGFEFFRGFGNKEAKSFKLWEKLGVKESDRNVLIMRKLK